MSFFFNELSIHNQFHNSEQFLNSLQLLWSCKELLNKYGYKLKCGRLILYQRQAVNGLDFQKTIGALNNVNLQRLIRRWIDQDGPFWDGDEERVHNKDDYFSNEADEIVTDTSLAEVACLTFKGEKAFTVSVKPSMYEKNPILINWYISTDETRRVLINNFWESTELTYLLDSLEPPIGSWEQLINNIKKSYNNLVFLPNFDKELLSQPFNHTISEHIVGLLSILSEFKDCFDDNGQRTLRGYAIYQDYFTGDNAKFSGESDQNKRDFEKEMTFYDENGEKIFCPYHGKISHNFYRIHFSWPITKEGNLYIGYIGPKITKK
jgi:hypothetical protein